MAARVLRSLEVDPARRRNEILKELDPNFTPAEDETAERVLDLQRQRWQTSFASRPEMFGLEPSFAARRALSLFQREGKRKILELGSGQGRDTLLFPAKRI